ncbi:MAG: Acyl carrier protein [Syntrophorhabdus sp. PtaB.Bin184]|nr:MAG: Acyl carrier protein [Syntrophorhabdus sp. PtaB.Bin184]
MNTNMMEAALATAHERRAVTERLKDVLIEKLRLPLEADEIAEDSPLFGLGLGLDSVDALEIVVGVEQEFGLSITDEDMAVFRSVNTIIDFVIDRDYRRA